MKAMILAAGRGERMLPLTATTPKPLLKIGNTTLIEHTLHQVHLAGIQDVVINVHHLGDQIIQYCGDGAAFDLSIRYSVEPTLLETGGGVFNALPLLGDEPFLLLSADVWTDFPLKKLLQKKISGAHVVLVDNPDYHRDGDFALDANGLVCMEGEKKLTYANISIIHPRLFYGENHGVFRLTKILRPAIENKMVMGECYAGEWHNVGTVGDLEKLVRVKQMR